MFTGIIQSVGQLLSSQETAGDYRFKIATGFADMTEVQLGDSIAVDGICLTVDAITGDQISVDVSLETVAKTTVNQWHRASKLNLEKSLCLKDKLGGHLVSGHVDATAECINKTSSARSVVYEFEIPDHLKKYVVNKGSICINGVSLTINQITSNIISVNLIPHTIENTNLGLLKLGGLVNVEIDTIARYVEKMLGGRIINETKT